MKKIVFFFIASIAFASAKSQVKIGDNPGTINSNSLLELESTTKGFLPPRVALNDPTNVAPLTGTVPAGMLVFSTGGTMADGYYYWSGSYWTSISSTQMVTKTADASLNSTERFVLASNDITLTLPAVTAANNGFTVTIKNIGTHTDKIKVIGNSSATIDGKDSSILTRWVGRSFVAYNGNWITKEKENTKENVLEVSPTGSWTTIDEALDYLNEHMSGPSVIKLSGGSFEMASTIVIDLPFPLSIQGDAYSQASLEATSGLAGTPMFRCLTECYFKMLAFDATTLTNYGNNAGEDAIQFEGSGEYYEVKDCSFDGFNKTLAAETNIEIWVFEVDIINAKNAGIELAAGVTSGVTLKVSEVDFTSCVIGIHLLSGADAVVSLLNSTFYNAAGGVGIKYVPATFTTFSSLFITNNAWNNEGTFYTGFDFTRTDGRDSKAFIQNNAGKGDESPWCRISVTDNGSTTSLVSNATWYKANWTNTASSTVMWTINNNQITYQPTNRRNGWAVITGNIAVNNNNRTVTICIVKNGTTTTRIGETDLRLTTQNQPFQFATVIYLEDIGPNDYFEVFCKSANSGDIVTFRDVQWFTETK